MKRRAVLESAVVARIVAELRKRPGIMVRKRHGTAMGVAGDADLYGSIRGRHFEIEVKRPNDLSSQLTKLQTERLQDWQMAGAITGVARSVADALQILGLAMPDTPAPVWFCTGCREYRWQSADAPARCPDCGHTRFETEATCAGR